MKKIFLILFVLGFGNVFSAAPGWLINPNNFQFSMNMTGVLVDTCDFSGEIGDTIAAFNGADLRGVGEISQTVNGKHLVFITIYSNSANGDTITFKHYSVSQDVVQDLAVEEIFTDSKVLGEIQSPFQLYVTEPVITPSINLTDSVITIFGTEGLFLNAELFHNGASEGSYTDTIISLTESGDYYVVINTSGGCDYSIDTVTYSIVGINELKSLKLTVYPNPTSNYIYFEGVENGGIEIFNLEGKIVLASSFFNGNIDVSVLEKGYYTLLLRSKETFYTSSFIKE